MKRYIDVDALLSRLPDVPYKGSVKRVLMQAPTEDVVPRTEVENWQTNQAIRREVAREIFAEIDEIMHGLMSSPLYSIGEAMWDVEELKEKYLGE